MQTALIVEIKRTRCRRIHRTSEEAAAIKEQSRIKAAQTMRNKHLAWKEDKSPPFKPKLNPIIEAQKALRNRLMEHSLCDGLAWFLDGRPATLDHIMREANKVRKFWGMEQITICERWKV